MDLVTRALPNDNYLWWIYGAGATEWFWSRFQAGGGFYESQWLTISHRPIIAPGEAAIVDLSGNNTFVDPRDADAITFDIDGRHMILPRNVEYFDSSLATTTEIRWLEHFGATTDGSLDKLHADVGNHEFNFTTAIKDSSLHLGAGWDTVNLIDHRDVPGEQYWALIRRDDNALDAYSLLTGRRIRMEDGLESRNGLSGKHNFGEVEILTLADSLNGGTLVKKPGIDIPTGPNNRGTFTNIDLRSDGQTHSDSFNLAYFNFIRYTSDNVWVGEATVHDGTDYSTPSDRRVVTEKSGYDYAAPVLEGQLSVIGQSRNGTHDLIVEQQETAIDGKLRLYAFDVDSGLYNEFNYVYLGDENGASVDKSGQGAGFADRVALYGFGGNDILKGGAGRDYIFGGQSIYNQLLGAPGAGNQVTGGAGADYFGVGNTNSAGAVSGSNTTVAVGKGDFHQGYATDVVMDWRAQDPGAPHSEADTLVVLSNGVAVIGGLRGASGDIGLEIANTIDLRDYVAFATSDQDFDGPRGGDDWDATRTLDHVNADQWLRDANSIANESDRTVVNEGLIVARGLGGADIIYGSPGDDYLYGNKASNSIHIGNGGNDRVYYDTFDGSASKHFVTGFTVLDDDPAEADKFFVNKRVIDAFSGSDPNRDLIASDANGSYVSAVKYNSGFNFLHSSFYNPGYAVDNNTHKKEDGRGLYDFDVFELVDEPALPPGPSGADGDSSLVGLGFYVAAKIAYSIPFVGPAIAAGLTASAKLLGGAGGVVVTTPHQNATYSGDVGNYLNVLTGAGLREPDTEEDTELDTSVKFLDFFPSVDAGDGFLPVVEFTANAGESIYGYFAMHSSDHTFVYLVASRDNLVENSEAILVAQVEGHLKAEDFGVYDGDEDIYNYKEDGEPAVVILEPRIDTVSDSDTSPDFGFDRGEDTANPANDLLIIAPSDAAKAKVKVTGIIEGVPNTGSSYVVYDGGTVVFDTARPGDFSGASFTTGTSGFDTTFTFIDGRPLGTVAVLDQDENEDGDGNWTLTDSRVTYTVELKDGTTGIATRGSVSTVTVEGGLTTIDGGNGEDTLTVTKTSGFLNGADDDQIVNFQNFVLVATGNEGVELDLQNQNEGFTISASNNGDTITGGSVGANNFIGGAGADSITGGAGDDTFNGFAGEDTLVGGAGTNTLLALGTSSDLNSAQDAQLQDIDIVQVEIGESLPTFSVTVDSSGAVTGVLVENPGSGLQDGTYTVSLTGSSGSGATVQVTVSGGSVDIPLNTTPPSNPPEPGELLVGDPLPIVPASGGTGYDPELVYTIGSTAIPSAGLGAVVVLSNQSEGFTIIGDTYADSIIGGAGNDTIFSGGGEDTLRGGAGSDTFVIENGGRLGSIAIIDGGAETTDAISLRSATSGTYDFSTAGAASIDGIERISFDEIATAALGVKLSNALASGSDDNGTVTISSSVSQTQRINIDGSLLTTSSNEIKVIGTNFSGGDSMVGGAGNDTIDGGAGNDTINGGNGDDLITGGAGADTLTGGIGRDTFVFGSGHSTYSSIDVITDFTFGTGADSDFVDLTAINAEPRVGYYEENFANLDALITLATNPASYVSSGAKDVFVGRVENDVYILSNSSGMTSWSSADPNSTIIHLKDSASTFGSISEESFVEQSAFSKLTLGIDITSGKSLGEVSGPVRILNDNFGGVETIDGLIYINPELVGSTDILRGVNREPGAPETTSSVTSRFPRGENVLENEVGIVIGHSFLSDMVSNPDILLSLRVISTDKSEVIAHINNVTVPSGWKNAQSFFYVLGFDDVGARETAKAENVRGNDDNGFGALWYWDDNNGDGIAATAELTLVAIRPDLTASVMDTDILFTSS